MAISASVHCVGRVKDGPGKDIIGFLTESGINVQRYDPYVAHGPGVLLFDEVGENLCELLREASRNGKENILACCCTALPGKEAWRLVYAGASDALSCPEPEWAASEIIARLQRWEAVEHLITSAAVRDAVVGESPAWKAILRQVAEVAHFTEAPVLTLGESGTGKELIARLIHTLDSRSAKKNLITLDCSTIIPELSGSEFFGHERGAFTGAVSARDGAFALADGGTLFLDEVGELPESLQSQLLRVIQEHMFKRVGGNAWQRSSFRLVCATNRDLWAQVQHGQFRADLYFRLASFISRVPSLRERPEDILPLARRFLMEIGPDRETPELDTPVLEYLMKREYPGNVRDLKQLVARIYCRHTGQRLITVGCIPPGERLAPSEENSDWRDAGFDCALRKALAQGIGLKAISRAAEETAIRLAVGDAEGNLQRAARRLGVTDRILQMRRAAQRHDS